MENFSISEGLVTLTFDKILDRITYCGTALSTLDLYLHTKFCSN